MAYFGQEELEKLNFSNDGLNSLTGGIKRREEA
jgi:hypothetical protein